MRIHRKTRGLAAAVAIALIAAMPQFSWAAEPADATSSVPPSPSNAPAGGWQALDFGRPCNVSPESRELLERQDGKRQAARQDPAHPFTRPDYPSIAQALGQEGQLIMLLLVSEEGRIAMARVDRSSGYPLLDQAALEATRNWRVLPARIDGKPVCSWDRFQMNFRLSDYQRAQLESAKIRPGASHLLELLTNFRMEEQIARASGALPDDQTSKAITLKILESGRGRESFEKSLHDSLALISLQLSDDEIQRATQFLESPIGTKLQNMQPELFSELRATFIPTFNATACQVALMRRTLDSRKVAATQLPEEFGKAVPRLLDETQPYCECAVKRSDWLSTMLGQTLALSGDLAICGKLPELKW